MYDYDVLAVCLIFMFLRGGVWLKMRRMIPDKGLGGFLAVFNKRLVFAVMGIFFVQKQYNGYII